MSWFRDRDHRWPKALEERRGAVVLVATASVRQIAACDHDLRVDPLDQRYTPVPGSGRPRAEMEVGDVQDASSHRRSRLYSGFYG